MVTTGEVTRSPESRDWRAVTLRFRLTFAPDVILLESGKSLAIVLCAVPLGDVVGRIEDPAVRGVHDGLQVARFKP